MIKDKGEGDEICYEKSTHLYQKDKDFDEHLLADGHGGALCTERTGKKQLDHELEMGYIFPDQTQ